jgi:Ni/Co efflux regulator RcnB
VDPFIWPTGFGYRTWRLHEILPPIFLSETYFLDDYSAFGLPDAPYGYQWIRVGDDALLVSLDTGEIVDEVRGVFYY